MAACRSHGHLVSPLLAVLGAVVIATALAVPMRASDPPATPAPTARPTPEPGPTPARPPSPLGGPADPWLDVIGSGDEPADSTVSPDCHEADDPLRVADELLADRYQLGSWPTVTLAHELAWTEDPYADANWRLRLHSLRFVLDLVDAGVATGNAAYADRALEIAADWVADNPRDDPPADFSWSDHSTALRAVVLTCIADLLPWPDWLEGALRAHGEALADPTFYVGHGNHALDQSIGLLEIGRVLGEDSWIRLAVERINGLAAVSIDEEGVSVEQSIGYQRYNWLRYTLAEARMRTMGLIPSTAFARVPRMPELLAYGTLPWGAYEMIGDTTDGPATAIPGTWAEYTATGGTSGPRPPTRIRSFAAGYLFARSGWGTRRAFADETALSLQWGAGRQFHGHDDGGSLTLAAWGSRLLLDPGLYAYRAGDFRTFMTSRPAHNVVTVDGVEWKRTRTTRLVGLHKARSYLDVRLRTAGYAGVVHDRRVTWSRGLDYLVVEDRLSSKEPHTYRQLWHLPPGSDPAVGTRAVRTRQAGGNVLVRQLAGDVRLRVVTGRTSPIQGWVSLQYATLSKAPVIEAIKRGRTVRYVTLVVPARGRPDATVLSFATRPGGYALRIRVGGRTERLVVDGSTVRLTEG